MRLELVTPPASEPITTADAKLHLRVDGSSEDAQIDLAIARARTEAENRLGRVLITQTWRLYLDCFPESGEIGLPLPPLQSVTSVQYVDTDGVTQTLDSGEYVVDTSGERGRIYLAVAKHWPSIRIEPRAVRVVFVAGYGDSGSDVPATFRSWMLIRIGDHYAHREGTVTGSIAVRLPFVDSLLDDRAVLF